MRDVIMFLFIAVGTCCWVYILLCIAEYLTKKEE